MQAFLCPALPGATPGWDVCATLFQLTTLTRVMSQVELVMPYDPPQTLTKAQADFVFVFACLFLYIL